MKEKMNVLKYIFTYHLSHGHDVIFKRCKGCL